MTNENNFARELIRFSSKSEQTGASIDVQLWSDGIEIKPPIVLIITDKVIMDIALQDVGELVSLLNSLIEKVSLFINEENLELNEMAFQEPNT